MEDRYPAHWRQWARRRPGPAPAGFARFLRSRIFQMVAMMMLVSFAVAAAVVIGAPLTDLGDLDAWSFWLQEAGTAREAASAVLLGHNTTVTLALVNRPQAEDVVVLVDGRKVAAFDDWKVELPVSEGDTISVEAVDGAEPVRIRLVAARGVSKPPLGSEWSVISGEKILASVTEQQ